MKKDDYSVDAKLVLDYQSGNNLAMAELVKRWHKTFCNKAYWIVNDKQMAKDIAQDSWKTIIEKIDGLNNPRTFASWSLRIVCNKSFDWVKKDKKSKEHLESFKYEETTHEIEDEQALETERQQLLKAINALPIHQQMVIKLFYTESYSLKEISKTLHISEGTAKSRLFHAREKLKQLLRK